MPLRPRYLEPIPRLAQSWPQHEKHVEALFADVLHNTGDLFALDDRFMDGLSQLLNEFAQARCHVNLRAAAGAEGAQEAARDSIYLTSTAA